MKTQLVVLQSGEQLECRGDDERGVWTDAGIIAWEEVLAFRIWSKRHQQWFSIPM